jgi:cyanophycinase-like exopeptidase
MKKMKNISKYGMMAVGIMCSGAMFAQSYTSYLTGNPVDLEVQPQFGLCLMGGAGESDEAMIWFLERANGGDVVVLRASGSDGYNEYMYTELGVDLNSVETIVFNTAEAANDPYVIERVQNAEAIWMAGGDQNDYVTFWQDTPIQDAINNLLNVKQGPVGGISAGMAVLGQAYFPASSGTINSENALNNPFAPQMQFGWNDFIDAPFMQNVITETHLNDPERIRYGRVTAFLARLGFDQGIRPFGMASNEYCAIAIDENGLARAFGEYPAFDDDFVYFLQGNCVEPSGPEIIVENQPLTWDRNNQAVKVYQVPATANGQNYLDLNTWTDGEGGFWEDWYVVSGELTRSTDATAPDCLVSVRNQRTIDAVVFPNPTSGALTIKTGETNWKYRVYDLTGRLLQSGNELTTERTLDLGDMPSGLYKLSVETENEFFSTSFVVSQ